MKIDILTLFPKMFAGPFAESIVARAQDKLLVEMKIHNLRDWATDKRGTVDDRPFGGGVGMILAVDIVSRALAALKPGHVILLTPQGKTFNQKLAGQLSKLDHLILICGHYEGFDERIRRLVDEEISIGDYVLTGGEIPAMVMVDAVTRLIPGVLEKPEATKNESFSDSLLEYPQYTRPAEFKGLPAGRQGLKVPKILLSGDHQKIADWRQKMALAKTKKLRPDLLK